MKSITKPGDNLGGLLKIWAVPASVYSVSGNVVSFSSTTNIYEIYCSPESMKFDEQEERTTAGKHHNTTISGVIPKDCSTALDAINDMDMKPYVIIFRNGNGEFQAAGTALQPLRIDAGRNSGRLVSDLAGNSFSFSGKTTSRAIFIDNPFE